MDKALTRILALGASLVVLFFCVSLVSSITQLADAADRVSLGLGQTVFWVLLTAFVVFLLAPIILYYRLPKALIPPEETEGPDHEAYLLELRRRLALNPRLSGMPLLTDKDISAALSKLSSEADRVITQTASAVFVGTAVMQNGRLDGLITLVTQGRMIWRLATIFYQRPSPRQILYLYSNVGMTALLSESISAIEFSELAAPVVASIIPSAKGAVPGIQGISNLLVNSIANGTANAFLTLRVGIVARKYLEAIAAPSRQETRRSATVAALALVGTIARENGTLIATSTWNAVKDSVVGAVDVAVQGAKKTAEKATKTVTSNTKAGVKALGGAFDSTVEGVKELSRKIKPRQGE